MKICFVCEKPRVAGGRRKFAYHCNCEENFVSQNRLLIAAAAESLASQRGAAFWVSVTRGK